MIKNTPTKQLVFQYMYCSNLGLVFIRFKPHIEIQKYEQFKNNLRLKSHNEWLLVLVKICVYISKAYICLLQQRANTRTLVSYTPNPTGEKHTISTFVDQTRIQLTRQRRKKQLFFKTSLASIASSVCQCLLVKPIFNLLAPTQIIQQSFPKKTNISSVCKTIFPSEELIAEV